MIFTMNELQPPSRDMSVNLSGGDIAVSEQHLHHAQVRAVIEQMCGKGVAKGVRRQRISVDAREHRVPFDDVPKRLPRHRFATRG